MVKMRSGNIKLIAVCTFITAAVIALGLLVNANTYKDGAQLAGETDLSGKHFYHLKEGYYCGGCLDDHYIGYIYFDDTMTAEEAMDEAGFHDLGHIFSGWGEPQKEYCTSEYGEHAVIKNVEKYMRGYILTYYVIGAV